MKESRRIVFLHPSSRLFEVRAITGLIAERPEDNGCLILIPNDVLLNAIHNGLFESGILRDRTKLLQIASLVIQAAYTVALNVRLADHVETITAA